MPAAEQLYREALALDAVNRPALENLVMICLQDGRADEGEHTLRRLTAAFPGEALYCDRLATLLERRGKGNEAIACYRRLLAAHPTYTNSRYNLARLLKRCGQPDMALREYEDCLARGIAAPEDALTNISVIHSEAHRHEEAERALLAALERNADFVPALFNLALLREEQGNWDEARALFLRTLEREPRHADALAHIAQGDRIGDPVDPLIRRMKRALRHRGANDPGREQLLYALGKAHDDCASYSRAFDYYRQANLCSQQRTGRYDPAAQERVVDQLISVCDAAWIDAISPVSQAPHIFICGMFRSGSTLVEQILAAHPAVEPGGEINYFQRALTPFPAGLLAATAAQLHQLGQGYDDYIASHFPGAARVSNKRPDNFLLLGMLRGLYPNARIIHSRRDPLDNCLSLFFQPLEAEQAYANDLLAAGHYYLQYQRLLRHWAQAAGASIFELHYEQLVAQPEETIAALLAFLQLDWHEGCLRFHEARNRVRTASVHQVRQPLYAGSSGRWRNYATALAPLHDYFESAGILG